MHTEKYEFYRERLRTYFMAGIGPDIGMSLPAMSWDTVNGIVKWSDCTIDHGHYLGVLGSEYKILSTLGEDTEQVAENSTCATGSRLRHGTMVLAKYFFGST